MHNQEPLVFIAVDLTSCRAHLFRITMTITHASPNLKLSLPVWTPGSYMIREFAQHLLTIKAHEFGRDLVVEKLDKNTFALDNTSSEIMVSYDVYGFDSSIRAAFIDESQAFFNGTALFLRPHGLEDCPYQLIIHRPHGELFVNWRVASAMTKRRVDSDGFGAYHAANYDELVDHPFQISVMKRLSFVASKIPHEMVLVGDVRAFDEARLIDDLAKLCTYQIELFGGIAPFSSYLFIARFEEGGHGGLEHRNSAMLLSSPYCLPRRPGEPDANYRSFLGLCSHEYFHAWNVKRLKPKSFVKYDYDRECYTNLLWLFEGITSYYDDLSVVRSNLITPASYLDMMGKNYSRLLRNFGRKYQSLAESSFDAWIKFYRPNENSQNSGTSYYLKGSFIGLYLDVLIREHTKDQVSLDDVMRMAYERYGSGLGIREEEFFDLLHRTGGIDSEDFKRKFICGTDDIPIEQALDPFGIKVSFAADEFYLDDKIKMSAFLGFKLRFDEHARGVITTVLQDGPGMDAGLCPLDEIIAINGIRLEPTNASDLLMGLSVNDKVDILYARKNSVRTTGVLASSLPQVLCKFSIKDTLDEKEKFRLHSWLRK